MKSIRICVFATLPLLLSASPCAAEVIPCPATSSHISMESGSYSSGPGVEFALHHFVATLVPQGKTAPACLQKMTDVSRADIFVSNESLTQVFSKKLGATDSNIRDLKVTHDANGATLTGEIVKLVPIKFMIQGPVSTDGTVISMTAQKIDAEGIPVKMLLGMVGQQLSSVFGMKGVSGVEVKGNVMSFSPEKVAHLRGYLTSVQTSPAGLTLHYGRRPGTHVPSVARLGKLTAPRTAGGD